MGQRLCGLAHVPTVGEESEHSGTGLPIEAGDGLSAGVLFPDLGDSENFSVGGNAGGAAGIKKPGRLVRG